MARTFPNIVLVDMAVVANSSADAKSWGIAFNVRDVASWEIERDELNSHVISAKSLLDRPRSTSSKSA